MKETILTGQRGLSTIDGDDLVCVVMDSYESIKGYTGVSC